MASDDGCAPLTEVDLSGISLDEYFMENCKIDPSLTVSRPDATLMVSRQTSRSVHSETQSRLASRGLSQQGRVRRADSHATDNASLVVTAPASREGRAGATSVQSSVLSFGSLISDGEDGDSDDGDDYDDSKISLGFHQPTSVAVSKVLMGGSRRIPASLKDCETRVPVSISSTSTTPVINAKTKTPPSTSVAATRHSSKWRRRLGIEADPMANKIIASRLELKMRDWLAKQLLKLPQENESTSCGATSSNSNTSNSSNNNTSYSKVSPSWRKSTLKPVHSIERIKRKHRENRIRMSNKNSNVDTALNSKKKSGSPEEGASSSNPTHKSNMTDAEIELLDKKPDPKLGVYKQLFEMFLSSGEGRPYRDMFQELIHLQEAEIAKVSVLRRKIEDLHIQIIDVEKKAQERIVAVYKHANEENKRLKAELHTVKTVKRVETDLATNRAIAAEEQLLDLMKRNNILEGQRTQLLHVHDILLKYFKMHAKWKSVGEDEEMLKKLGLGDPLAIGQPNSPRNGKKKRKKKKKEKEKVMMTMKKKKKGSILSVNGTREDDCNMVTSIDTKSDMKETLQVNSSEEASEGYSSDDVDSHLDEIDASIAASAVVADALNEQSAAHEHELAEWKQVHLSLQSLSDAHMAALSDITELTNTHSNQLDKAHKKIEALERENAKLLIARGPLELPVPDFITEGLISPKDEDETRDTESVQMAKLDKENGSAKVAASDESDAENIGNVGGGGNGSIGGARGCGPKRVSRYKGGKLNISKDEFEGLAPIVVDILLRRPLPALDKDAVIIKRNNAATDCSRMASAGDNGGSEQKAKKPCRPSLVTGMRPKPLHSNNKRSSFARAKRKKAEEIRARAKLKHPSMQ